MKICFPVEKNDGISSQVYGHFGSAPVFLVVETADSSVQTIQNRDMDHAHGACNPIKALNNQEIHAVVVGGIGAGALSKLQQMGIRVFQAQVPTIEQNLSLLSTGSLPEFTLQSCCAGHGHGGGCGH